MLFLKSKNLPEFNQSIENFRKDILLDTGALEPVGKKRKFVDDTTSTTAITEITRYNGIPSNKVFIIFLFTINVPKCSKKF